MYRLLIVDDEPDVLDGIYAILMNQEDLDLDVYKADSAQSALEMLDRERMDIIMSDICMPGMNGIELLRQVRASWPECRVIFLTGHPDFNYIYSAEKLDAAGYVLKTEGRQRIIQALDNAVSQIEEARRLGELEAQLDFQTQAHRPYLLREMMSGLISAELERGRIREAFAQLCPGFDPDKAVLAVAARINSTEKPDLFQKARFYISLEELTEKYLKTHFVTTLGETERWTALLLLQPRNLEPGWEKLAGLARGSIEAMQTVCMEQLGIYLSLAISMEPVAVIDLKQVYDDLYRTLQQEINYGAGIKLVGPIGKGFPSTQDEAQAVALIRSYVEENFERNLSLTFLAGKVYLNPSYLSRLFKRQTGMTLIHFINMTRMNKARELLLTTNMKVSDIASGTGYESPSYFNQAFKKFTGVSPLEYRLGKS